MERRITFHKQIFKTVTSHVSHVAHIRVRYTGDIQQLVPVYFLSRQAPVHSFHTVADTRLYLLQQIATVRLYENAEKSASLMRLLQEYLIAASAPVPFPESCVIAE